MTETEGETGEETGGIEGETTGEGETESLTGDKMEKLPKRECHFVAAFSAWMDKCSGWLSVLTLHVGGIRIVSSFCR